MGYELADGLDPTHVPFQVGDMRRLSFRSSFHALTCIGTTFLYNVRNEDITATLAAFHRALRPGGLLLIDVVNASTFIQARPFRSTTVHRFRLGGVRATATIAHTVIEEAQCFTEQVTWRFEGQPPRKDARSSFRMLFPQEARHFLEGAGFREVRILGDFRESARRLDGPRMLLLARKGPATRGGTSPRSSAPPAARTPSRAPPASRERAAPRSSARRS